MNDVDRFKFSFRNAFDGIKTAFRTQRNLRIHLLAGALVIFLSILLRVSTAEFLVLLLTILIVLVTELLNTAIEFTINLASPEYNHLAKQAKDISSATLFIAALFAVLVVIMIFSP